jgi:hypothetical protein
LQANGCEGDDVVAVDCSVLERGFAHLACQDCGLPRLATSSGPLFYV